MKYLNLEEPDITLTAIVNEIAVNQSEVIITRNGLPVARIVPYSIPDVREKNYPHPIFTIIHSLYHYDALLPNFILILFSLVLEQVRFMSR